VDSLVHYREMIGMDTITGNATGVLILAHYLCRRSMLCATALSLQKPNFSGSAARTGLHQSVSKCYLKIWSQDALTAQLVVQHTHREVTRRLPSTKRRRLDEPDNRAMPATLAKQHSSIVEIAQERGSARRCAGIAVLALVPFDERFHVDLEEDLLDGGAWGALVGEVGGDLADGDGRCVQDPLAAVELVVLEERYVPRRVAVAEDAGGGGVRAGAGEGDHHLVALVDGAVGGAAGPAWEDGEGEGHLDRFCSVGLVGG
jgi:hypothetical protein